MGIWVAGPMPNPGKCITMMAHSRYGMLHPWILDGKQFRRGYTSGNFTSVYDVPCVQDTIGEAALRDSSIWLLDRMQVYAAKKQLGDAVPGVIPAVTVHVVAGRCELAFASPPKERVEIATLRSRRPPWNRGFHLTNHLENAPPCNEALSNSLLWDPLGNQWGRNGHWPLITTYGTTRYRCQGMVMPREVAAERRWERRQAAAQAQTYGGDVAPVAEEPHEAPDTGGASSSQGSSAALLPSLQAQPSREQAKWVGHTR